MTIYEDLIRGNKSYDRIMRGKKPVMVYETRASWCLGKHCNRFKVMGCSCPCENCNKKERV